MLETPGLQGMGKGSLGSDSLNTGTVEAPGTLSWEHSCDSPPWRMMLSASHFPTSLGGGNARTVEKPHPCTEVI